MKNDPSTQILDSCKRFVAVFAGSLFVQIVIWAIGSYFDVGAAMCGISALVTALLYHGLQLEGRVGISRFSVFCAAILLPFLLSAVVMLYEMFTHTDLTLSGAELDGVSPLVECIALYATRLTLNGAALLLFAAGDAIYLHFRSVKQQGEQSDET